jgi:prolyl-tRNA synthetase
VIVPMLRDDEGDAAVLDYCRSLSAELRGQNAFGEPLRVLLDTKATKAQTKRWSWVKKGAPIIVEIGPRDVGNGMVSWLRRDELYREGQIKGEMKINSILSKRETLISGIAVTIEQIQASLYAEAKARLDTNIARDVTDLAAHFKGGEDKFVGWVEVQWSRPTGAALDKIVAQLKALKLTMRNAPMDAAAADGVCFFTGEKAVERVLVGRTY